MNPVKKRVLIALGAALVVAVGFVAATINAPKGPQERPDDLVEYRDEVAGFSVSYPRFWKRIEGTKDPLVRLLVGPPATDDTLSVKVIRLPGKVVINSRTPPEDIAQIQSTLDRVIDQLPGLTEVVQRSPLVLNGTRGWYYIYKFQDKGTGERGIHFRYFMFEGDKEFIVTFQAFPEDHFAQLAGTFDKIVATFNFKVGQPDPTAPAATPAGPTPTG